MVPVTGSGSDGDRAQQLLRAVVEMSPHGMVLVDVSGRIVLVNREIERLFKYSREELIGQPVDLLVPERFRSRHAGHRTGFLDAPIPRPMGADRELFGLRKDGQEVPVEIGLNPLETEEGLFVLASVLDVGARKRAEVRFRAAVESSPAGMVMVDQEGRIVMVNREVERLFGYQRDELISRSIEILVPPQLRGHHPDLRAGYLSDAQPRAMGAGRDLFGVRKDGTEVAVEIGLNPIESDEGTFVLASVVDITARKRAEEELRRSNEELERFAYAASHDLQEPLRMVSSYVQLLNRRYAGKLDADADKFIAFALDGSVRMKGLIDDLLTYSRVGAGGTTSTPSSADAALDGALAHLALAITESKATITRDPLPVILADHGQLELLFLNLLSNALKFRGPEAPLIHVSATPGAGAWCFSVRDNGIGIKAEYFERIFVIFQRLHPRGEYSGSGMGLAIARKIVERNGGRIWVESEAGRGTTFFFTLPGMRGEASDARR